ncbi:DNA-binding MarR family transcriptional regulator [Clostridium acetobutylicum]|uniref:MarR family HTH transcriptional regulator n=2 Tax=Clostridium acetobutylicum TaxID=1488 RepID=Q97TS3_CLOAB|nr:MULTISPECIES: MarR family transcriptional regulator [Clostridium]AAK76770.1 MarR family HTH transcriptional regulator [Clostridium acetobutylicum ATCC 824]ADZ22806.1 MarR family HTH transcriptional regulator [Clostridium acetobutylicum EA 2018]AEI34766.1 MarR family HTH transcriptional regulator [Clostridium acetobutylicum DSM 1731]AWV82315.1 MarR family transcriptional regulator [Clostridium acetobutylicum]MBC2396021.1 MarR family transcriptional regulator [Clostridium acetobutylicum]
MNKEKEQQLNEALVLFSFAYKTFTEEPDLIIKKYGIQRIHHRILFFVARFPGLSVNELLKLLEISKQALHKPMHILINKGLIFSKESDYDRRIKEIFLTNEGERLEKEISNIQREHLLSIFSQFHNGDEKSWLEIMRQLSLKRLGYAAWNKKK